MCGVSGRSDPVERPGNPYNERAREGKAEREGKDYVPPKKKGKKKKKKKGKKKNASAEDGGGGGGGGGEL